MHVSVHVLVSVRVVLRPSAVVFASYVSWVSDSSILAVFMSTGAPHGLQCSCREVLEAHPAAFQDVESFLDLGCAPGAPSCSVKPGGGSGFCCHRAAVTEFSNVAGGCCPKEQERSPHTPQQLLHDVSAKLSCSSAPCRSWYEHTFGVYA